MMTEKDRMKCENEFLCGVSDGKIAMTDTKEIGGHKIGDVVMLLNGFDIEVGPFKILGFNKDGKMYLDWDCYWYPVPVKRIITTVREGVQE